ARTTHGGVTRATSKVSSDRSSRTSLEADDAGAGACGQRHDHGCQDTGVSGCPPFMLPDVPDAAWTAWQYHCNPRTNIGTFALRSDGKTILVDTGLGEKPREGYPPGNLLANLAEAGIKPEDVDLVVTTHLHLDHVGWNTLCRDDGWVTTFPNARYAVLREEWEFFTTDPMQRETIHIQENVLQSPASASPSGWRRTVARRSAAIFHRRASAARCVST